MSRADTAALDEVVAAVLAAIAKPGSGWRIVPTEATRRMLDEAERVDESGYWAMWDAMLAVAPRPAVNVDQVRAALRALLDA